MCFSCVVNQNMSTMLSHRLQLTNSTIGLCCCFQFLLTNRYVDIKLELLSSLLALFQPHACYNIGLIEWVFVTAVKVLPSLFSFTTVKRICGGITSGQQYTRLQRTCSFSLIKMCILISLKRGKFIARISKCRPICHEAISKIPFQLRYILHMSVAFRGIIQFVYEVLSRALAQRVHA